MAAERFAFDPSTGAAVFDGWRQELEELRNAPVPRAPLGKQDVVREMRTLLAGVANPLDFPLLGARLAVTLMSVPLDRLVDLQAASDMESFWGSLVRCIAAAEDPDEPAEALAILQRATQTAAPASDWEAAEAASIPGQPTPAPRAAATSATSAPPTAPGPAVNTCAPPAPGSQQPVAPRPLPLQWVTLSGARGLRSDVIMQAIRAQTGWDVALPFFDTPLQKDVWRVRVPAEEWRGATRRSPDIPVSVGGGRSVSLSPLPRWSPINGALTVPTGCP